MAWGAAETRAFDEGAARVEWSELRALIAGRVPERVLRRLAYTPAEELALLRNQAQARHGRPLSITAGSTKRRLFRRPTPPVP